MVYPAETCGEVNPQSDRNRQQLEATARNLHLPAGGGTSSADGPRPWARSTAGPKLTGQQETASGVRLGLSGGTRTLCLGLKLKQSAL